MHEFSEPAEVAHAVTLPVAADLADWSALPPMDPRHLRKFYEWKLTQEAGVNHLDGLKEPSAA